jgi:hypothetical protein
VANPCVAAATVKVRSAPPAFTESFFSEPSRPSSLSFSGGSLPSAREARSGVNLSQALSARSLPRTSRSFCTTGGGSGGGTGNAAPPSTPPSRPGAEPASGGGGNLETSVPRCTQLAGPSPSLRRVSSSHLAPSWRRTRSSAFLLTSITTTSPWLVDSGARCHVV